MIEIVKRARDKSTDSPSGEVSGMSGFAGIIEAILKIFSSFIGGTGLGDFFKKSSISDRSTSSPARAGTTPHPSTQAPTLFERGRESVSRTWNSLLDMIGHHESRGNHNVAYGGRQGNFTNMTLNEVLAWQKDYVKNGSGSSAVGKYQIIQGTLRGLMSEMNLTGQEKFDPAMQDRMAIHLLQRRGLGQFERGHMSETEFMRRLSQEWASLPKDDAGKSYYAGDKIGNKAHATPQEVRSTLRNIASANDPVSAPVASNAPQFRTAVAQPIGGATQPEMRDPRNKTTVAQIAPELPVALRGHRSLPADPVVASVDPASNDPRYKLQVNAPLMAGPSSS